MSTSETTNTLSEIINSLDEDDLRELCSSYCDDTNDNNAVNEFFLCKLLNLLQCYGSQFVRLILLIIFLYAWNNQMTSNYLMDSNCQLTNAVSNLLQECFEGNCCNKRK